MGQIENILKTVKYGTYQKLKKLDLLDDIISMTSFLNDLYPNIPWGQRFWHIKNETYHIVNCEICHSDPAKYSKSMRVYVPCSKGCTITKASKNHKEVVKKKYGVDNVSFIDGIGKKISKNSREAIQEKYGVDNYSQTEEFKDKIDYEEIFEKSKQTCDGVHPFLNKKIRKDNIKKHKKAFKEKYGDEDYFRTDDYKEKSKQTCQEKYGVDHYFQSEEFKALYKQIMLELYGVDNPSKSKEIQKKFKETCKKRYGVNHFSKSPEFLNKLIKTSRIKFGVDNFFQSEEFRRKTSETYREKFGVDHYVQSQDYIEKYRLKYFLENLPEGYEAIEYNKMLKLKHLKCGKEFEIERYNYNKRKLCLHEICTFCNPIGHFYSFAEKELSNFILHIYNKKIILNGRKVIHPYELDIYLPDLNLAFEFNGDFYHANPKFYKADDMIHYKSAKSIWEKDEKKKLRCVKKNINLIIIWEDDWVNRNVEVKKIIKDIISGRSYFESTSHLREGEDESKSHAKFIT